MSDTQALRVRGPLIKSVVFVVVMLLVLFVVARELGQDFGLRGTTSYGALFTDTSGLRGGDSVRIAGVEVGQVEDVSVVDSTLGLVRFGVETERPLPAGVTAAVRWLNLTGDRYLEIGEGPAAQGMLAPDAVIPVERTRPALDLDVLLAGFNPLFEGLEPDQINSLASQLVSVLQGQGGTIEEILTRTASLTATLADREEVIGRVVDNLNLVLGTLDENSAQVDATIANLQRLVTGLAGDRERLGESLVGAERLVTGVDSLLGRLRAPLLQTVGELDRAATQANAGGETLDEVLSLLPGAYLRAGRVGSRGSGYNLYFCSLRVKLTGPDGQPTYTPWIGPSDNIERCKPGVAPLEGGG